MDEQSHDQANDDKELRKEIEGKIKDVEVLRQEMQVDWQIILIFNRPHSHHPQHNYMNGEVILHAELALPSVKGLLPRTRYHSNALVLTRKYKIN